MGSTAIFKNTKESPTCHLTLERTSYLNAQDAITIIRDFVHSGAQGWAMWSSCVSRIQSVDDLSQRSKKDGTLLEAELCSGNCSLHINYHQYQWIVVKAQKSDQGGGFRAITKDYISTFGDKEEVSYEVFWDLNPKELYSLKVDFCPQISPVFARFVGFSKS